LRRRSRDATLDTSALIHEAFLKLVGGSRNRIRDRGHFLSLASRAMRQIVIDYARRKNAAKRGGGVQLLPESAALAIGDGGVDLLGLEQALERLEALEPRLARLIDLRFFGGMSAEETAEVLEISVATVKRDWLKARAFLFQQMRPQ
jgi:RNA polymerase sigma factor (TIGR02999 family)